MNAENFEAINVLNICKGFNREGLQHRLTPYRFMRADGRSHKILEIRHFHQEIKGGYRQLHYHVITGDGHRCRLLFDTGMFTWRLIEDRNQDGVILGHLV